jgi:hypothetical protein
MAKMDMVNAFFDRHDEIDSQNANLSANGHRFNSIP